MSEQSQNDFTAYEYKKVTVESNNASFYLDGYESFGWQQDENFPPKENSGKVVLYFKRSRKLVNRMELTRLQRNFEAAMNEIIALEHSKSTVATIWALCIGLVGTAFMAAAVFAITAAPPRVPLCIVLAIPAFAGSIPFSKRGRACFEQVTQKRLVNTISRFFAVRTIKNYL